MRETHTNADREGRFLMTTTTIIPPGENPFSWPKPGVCGWLDGTCGDTAPEGDWLCPKHREKVMFKPVNREARLAAVAAALLES